MSILSNLDYRLQCLQTLAPEYVFRHQTNGNSISQCRVIQHKGCGDNTVFYGVTYELAVTKQLYLMTSPEADYA